MTTLPTGGAVLNRPSESAICLTTRIELYWWNWKENIYAREGGGRSRRGGGAELEAGLQFSESTSFSMAAGLMATDLVQLCVL